MGDRNAPSGSLVPSDIQDQSISAHLDYTMGNHYLSFKAQKYHLPANACTGSPTISVGLPKRDLTKLGL